MAAVLREEDGQGERKGGADCCHGRERWSTVVISGSWSSNLREKSGGWRRWSSKVAGSTAFGCTGHLKFYML